MFIKCKSKIVKLFRLVFYAFKIHNATWNKTIPLKKLTKPVYQQPNWIFSSNPPILSLKTLNYQNPYPKTLLPALPHNNKINKTLFPRSLNKTNHHLTKNNKSVAKSLQKTFKKCDWTRTIVRNFTIALINQNSWQLS